MTVPWSGFALAALVALARPTARATFVRFESFHRPEIAAGQRQRWFPWPYTEGLTMAEATNELAFVATGLYANRLRSRTRAAAPRRPVEIRFKSIKSISASPSRTTGRRPSGTPSTTGLRLLGQRQPDVPFPDWSQKEERLLGGEEKVPTRIYNGYGPYVAIFIRAWRGGKSSSDRPPRAPAKERAKKSDRHGSRAEAARRAGGQALAAEAGAA